MTSSPLPDRPQPPPVQSERQGDVRLQQGSASAARPQVKLFQVVVRALFRLFFDVRVTGRRNVPRTAAIICANHLGWTDPFVILLFLPAEPRIYIVGERQVAHLSSFRNRVINWLEIMVALDRDKPMQALRIMEGVLGRGGSLLIFPEGHLGTREGDLRELQHGAAHLSRTSGAPLVPVGLTGTSELWLRRRIEVRIGRAITPGEVGGDTRTSVHAMTARLEREMRALLPGDGPHPRIKPLRRWLTNLF